jgi:hypothetical protein
MSGKVRLREARTKITNPSGKIQEDIAKLLSDESAKFKAASFAEVVARWHGPRLAAGRLVRRSVHTSLMSLQQTSVTQMPKSHLRRPEQIEGGFAVKCQRRKSFCYQANPTRDILVDIPVGESLALQLKNYLGAKFGN